MVYYFGIERKQFINEMPLRTLGVLCDSMDRKERGAGRCHSEPFQEWLYLKFTFFITTINLRWYKVHSVYKGLKHILKHSHLPEI